MIIEIIEGFSQKGTKLIDGNRAEDEAVGFIAKNYSFSDLNVHLHLVEPLIPNSRSDASYSSLRKKTLTLGRMGIRSEVFIHPYDIHQDDFRRYIVEGNDNQDTVATIVQMPVPEHLRLIMSLIDPVKDIDSLNPYNNIWSRCAAADAALRVLSIYHDPSQVVGLVGANGFVGRHIGRGIVEQGGSFLPVEFNDSLELLKRCQTIVSAVGQPNLIDRWSLGEVHNLGLDIGNIRANKKIQGDFNFHSVDGVIKYLTPVPGGMGPLEMTILAERIIKNALDSRFEIEYKRK